MKTIKYLAIAAIALLTVACSKEDNVIDNGEEQMFGEWYGPSYHYQNLAKTRGPIDVDWQWVLFGKLRISSDFDPKITIMENRTVILQDVTIEGIDNNKYKWAGITCAGNATIVLDGHNKIVGFNSDYPGIYIPEGKTLTIRGNGTLEVSCNGDNSAGIGSGNKGRCGNIIIEEGTVVAIGGKKAASIGAGYQGTCGNITIGEAVTSVKTIKGQDAKYGIGIGAEGKCGDIFFGSNKVYDGNSDKWIMETFETGNYGGMNFFVTTTKNENDTWTVAPPISLAELKESAKYGLDYSKYLGQYVDASGNVTPYPINAIGRVAYVSEEPVDVDASAAETRILVLALNDIGSFQWKKLELPGESAYNDPNVMCGLDFCSIYNNESYPAAYAAYNWDASKPTGSTNWFLPSQAQWDKMLEVAKMDGTGQMSTGRYWAANESSNALLTNSAKFYDFETGSWQEMIKNAELKVRACYAY